MVFGLPYHGYAWTLLDPSANEIGSPATGPAITLDGSMFYKFIKSYMRCDGEKVVYNSTYVTNYCINCSVWIGYDDVEAIRTKVSYARDKGLLGYKLWHVANDDNWVLSKAVAQEDGKDPRNKRQMLLVILLPTTATVTLVLAMRCGICVRVHAETKRPPNLGRDLPTSVKTSQPQYRPPYLGGDLPKLGRDLPGSVEISQARQTPLHSSASTYPGLGGNLPGFGGNLPKLGGDLPKLDGNLLGLGGNLPKLGGNLPRLSSNLPRLGGNLSGLGRNLFRLGEHPHQSTRGRRVKGDFSPP
ncbi:hypothetical protein RHSIM_Rhsim01G0037000 [Rhododendron simsii]|uniref:GH18 domain-containing protein n=1 Tax=Rhododendron simsii TaxID=118357 RepID=A0A834M0J5_RHOSS|nr:hypothetical protein RHSIM_Rhsim01G0037000 [Rhododendron simsii]